MRADVGRGIVILDSQSPSPSITTLPSGTYVPTPTHTDAPVSPFTKYRSPSSF